MKKGNFTLPGESGHEALTLELAKRFGADVIRDSDGTRLSNEILSAGYGIYSTICIVREHNEWIKQHEGVSQQTFLSTPPQVATTKSLSISLLDGFFAEQFAINDSLDGLRYWQVYDRTTDTLLDETQWQYHKATGTVEIQTRPWRQYTVSFLAWRMWEEISMYNHVTNHWDKEHLMQLNPYYLEAQSYLKEWLAAWCEDNPDTTVVRFTSLFYNFVWIWGSHERNRNLFVDWASYDFTVCPLALDDFAKEYGYALTAEDFVCQGKYQATHRVPTQKKRDWMDFIGRFVRKNAKELIDIVHQAGKKAYVFYDDNWVGLEPYNGHFQEFGFDGLIKCVFSGYEVRLCADVPVETHEIRFHPYLFPVGLGGAPTFSAGGKPEIDAKNYWVSTRRALLRKPIQRCGLGGYLSLTKEFPEFLDTMDEILAEFRQISSLHEEDSPVNLSPRIAILHAWGDLRTWTLSGHFHETKQHVLIHVLESLSGLPFEVEFISFDDIDREASLLEQFDVIISAGKAGDAWSGGILWENEKIVDALTKWVYQGGVFLGIDEPSGLPGRNRFLRMAHVLGVDIDRGDYACHGRWDFACKYVPGLLPPEFTLPLRTDVVVISETTQVLHSEFVKGGVQPLTTIHHFGQGAGVYLSGFTHDEVSPRFLLNLILYIITGKMTAEAITDNPSVEVAVFPKAGKVVFINNSSAIQRARVTFGERLYKVELAPYGMKVM